MLGSILSRKPKSSQPLHDGLTRLEALHAVQFLDEFGRRFRQAAQIVLVVGKRELAFDVEDADPCETVTVADLEVVEVVRRGDLHRAGALLGIGIFVGDDRDQAADQWQHDVLADQMRVALVIRIHRDAAIAQHCLRTRGGDDDERGRIFLIEALAFERIAQMPEVTLDLDLLHFEIGDRGQQLRIPVHKALVLVDQTLAMQLNEHLHDGLGQALVHGEAFARPVAGCAKALQLIDDDAAAFGLPLPDALEKRLAAHLAATGLLALHQLALDHHLGGDAGMVGAGLPQHVAAAHALEATQHVLQRVVEGVAHMQRTGHVRRRDHDRIGLGIHPVRTASLEGTFGFPGGCDAGLDIGGLIGLFDHDNSIKSGVWAVHRNARTDVARNPSARLKSTYRLV